MARLSSPLSLACLFVLAFLTQGVEVTVTAYSPTPDQTDESPFITASNTRVRAGIVALSRDLERRLNLKFGDWIHLEGYGWFQFMDRMNKRKRLQVDVFMWSRARALKHGVKRRIILKTIGGMKHDEI